MSYAEPDPGRMALVSIDVQRETLDGHGFEIPCTTSVVPTIARLAREFRAAQRPIIHVVRH